MKIFIYGFKPFKNYNENITQKILSKINLNQNINVKIFDVVFNKKMFKDEVDKCNPDIILGLGQYPVGKKIRIERTAHNLMAHSRKETPVKINENSPEKLYSTLKIKPDKHSRFTYNAGTYVCNFSMYVNLEYSHNSNNKYGFFHIPKDFSVKNGVNWINKLINSLSYY
ncbi:MAG: hypothetical protein ACQESP_10835 [Candidatus Muiribacteriota bacterium]